MQDNNKQRFLRNDKRNLNLVEKKLDTNLVITNKIHFSMEVELNNTRLDVKSKQSVNNLSGTLKNRSVAKLNLEGKVNLAVDKQSYFFKNKPEN